MRAVQRTADCPPRFLSLQHRLTFHPPDQEFCSAPALDCENPRRRKGGRPGDECSEDLRVKFSERCVSGPRTPTPEPIACGATSARCPAAIHIPGEGSRRAPQMSDRSAIACPAYPSDPPATGFNWPF